MASEPMSFETEVIGDFATFVDRVLKTQDREWIYRGQDHKWPLSATLERSLKKRGICLSEAAKIEKHIIRDFRRKYRGDDLELVKSDTFYCIALLQHHGAPTRLLDWTYSPFVAAKFALEHDDRNPKDLRFPAIWCVNGRWCEQAAKKIAGEMLVMRRDNDEHRGNSSFIPLYMNPLGSAKFVLGETPLYLSERIIVQQGKFLCPGDVSVSFEDNITAMDGSERADNILKIQLKMDDKNKREFESALSRMNVNSAVLYPGLDGLAKSLGENIFHFQDLR